MGLVLLLSIWLLSITDFDLFVQLKKYVSDHSKNEKEEKWVMRKLLLINKWYEGVL